MQSQVGASVRSNPACERTLLPPSFLSGTEFASPSHSAALNKFVSPNLGGTAKKQPLKLRGSPLRLPTRAPGPRENWRCVVLEHDRKLNLDSFHYLW